jgi:hypothetical protein
MAQKQKSSEQDQLDPIPAVWLYNELMKHIEPDLTVERIVRLDELYAGETEVGRIDRLKQYAIAFQIFEECLEEIGLVAAGDVRLWKSRMSALAMENPSNSAQ